ncbi:MAG: hypothetical protein P1P69_04630 [Methanosarcinaceae archaeon]|nr:hypothetical protein [Methanosarcinaceae archaeon]
MSLENTESTANKRKCTQIRSAVGFFDIKKQASPKISKNILGVGGICRM